MRTIDFNDAVDAVQKYCSTFTHNVSNSTKERWVDSLMEIRPDFDIVQAAISRCADNDLGAAWSRLRTAINVETSISIAKRESGLEGQSEAYRQFLLQYEKDGFGRDKRGIPAVVKKDRKTPEIVAGACIGVINSIISKRLSCPEPWNKHDVFAQGDEEERWFWMQVEQRLDR